MKLSTHLKVASSAVVALLLGGSALSGLSAPARPSAAPPTRNVIVILRDQRADLPAVRGTRSARAAALSSAQTPILSHLQASGAARIRSFSMINAIAATVSDTEAEQLAAHPLVQAVVPDRVMALPRRSDARAPGRNGSSGGDGGGGGGGGSSSALCNTLEPEALELMNVAFLDPSKPQAQRIVDGNGELVTGKGVKVAWIADGLDPTIPGFTHTDGTPVFIDYQNFGGDPAGTPATNPETGGEAFGDASSIAAQDTPNGKLLTFDISQFVNAAHPLPSPCRIRIRGVAPGASLVGLDVFSSIGITTNSAFLQAIEYAVFHDDVDVLNESFGANPFPDNDNDPIALADQAAVAAGVTVVVSTGDAGTNGTMGTPSTDAVVISSGATTQLRNYAQTGDGAAFFAKNGWISGNISSFSSGGFSMSGPRVPDTVAPGDLGWALCSTDVTLFPACINFATTPVPTNIQQFGGTSESTPLTSGVAALVIQAYRSTHNGRNPSPALVKRILMSTATDLGAPPSEEGAGFIDAYRAVKTALAVWDENGHPSGGGGGLLNSPTSASIVDQPRDAESVTVAITNTGKATQHLQPTLQALGPAIAGQTLTLTLDPAHDPTFPNITGSPRAYITQQFKVPPGAQHLDAAIAWQSPFFANQVIAYLGLIDPKGRNAAYTIPQGFSSGYGHVDIVAPTPGSWTAIIWTRAAGIAASYSGPVKFTWSAERYVPFGSVSPASFDLASGATQYVTARFRMPSQPGDEGVAIRFGSSGADGADGAHAEIPIALRTLIPISHGSGSFSGTLTGGNGRPSTGPTQTFAFDVPPGVNNMALNLEITDPLYLLEGLLIDPNGMQLSVQPNVDANGISTGAMQLNRANPMAGRWRFILLVDYFTSGNQTSLPFEAQIGFNTAQVSVSALPNDPATRLSASGAPVVVPITITNTGGLAQAYFADARLNTSTALAFGTAPVCTLTGGTTPVTTLPYSCFETALPTQVRSVEFLAQSNVPITMDVANDVGYIVGGTGAPDLFARPIGPDTIAASLTEPEVPWGVWELFPSEIGPYGPAGAPTAPIATEAILKLKAFDASVSADSGDLWSDVTFGTSTFNPLILAPGQTGTINVTITPNPAQVGTTVRGRIFVDTFNGTVQTGDEVVSLPYSYTVAR
ncbi:MAG TPA: S8 family serine peptidase [Steroidobacteraceae bacterium]|nr:S8 family serine peptidase [Steroidobacteraceae bacterium]